MIAISQPQQLQHLQNEVNVFLGGVNSKRTRVTLCGADSCQVMTSSSLEFHQSCVVH